MRGRRLRVAVVVGVLALLVPVGRTAAVQSRAAVSPAGFVHPGILVDRNQLYFVRTQIAHGAQPWAGALAAAAASGYGAGSGYVAHPVPDVQCGFDSANIGCDAEVDDADAAYTQALLWYYTGEAHYAATAVGILDAWSTTLQTQSGYDRSLFSAWAAETFTRAAEVIRYTYPSWSTGEISQFTTVLTTIWLPLIAAGAPWQSSNWELSMADGLIDIGVFTDDRTVFNEGLAMWRARVPAYIYLRSDGPLPTAPPGGAYRTPVEVNCLWLWTSGPGYTACRAATPAVPMATFSNGQTQEMCRDFTHVGMSYAALLNAAETARLQGVNLYAEQATRIQTGLEFAAGLLTGSPAPPGLCANSATPHTLTLTPTPTWEIGYDEFATRATLPMPHLQELIALVRPTGVFKQMAWETLTSAGTGRAG